jgi:hypothetical protein
MSGFDHDAWMQRGAERQEVVADAARQAYDYVDRQQAVGDNEALIRLSIAVLTAVLERQTKRPIDQSFDTVLKRKAEQLLGHMAKKAQSEFESDAMALALAQQLLESGTNKIISDLGMWESDTFREKVES